MRGVERWKKFRRRGVGEKGRGGCETLGVSRRRCHFFATRHARYDFFLRDSFLNQTRFARRSSSLLRSQGDEQLQLRKAAAGVEVQHVAASDET